MQASPYSLAARTAAIGTAAASPTPRTEVTDSDVIKVTVPASDLAPSGADGANRLPPRRRQAATLTRGGKPDFFLDPRTDARFKACASRTMDRAVAQVRAPMAPAPYEGERRVTLARR